MYGVGHDGAMLTHGESSHCYSVVMRLVLAIALVVGCGGTDGRKRGSDREARLAAFEARMCACADKTCATTVMKEMATWTRGLGSAAAPIDADRAGEIMKSYNACMTTTLAAP